MHRQSLGSPASKLHGNGVAGVKVDVMTLEDQKRKEHSSSIPDDDEVRKAQKPHISNSPPAKYVHIIPILTLLCFLILYLSSHDPSPNDLAQFNGFKRHSNPADPREIDNFGRVLEIQRGDILAIRSTRILQEISRRNPKYRPHRKIGDF